MRFAAKRNISASYIVLLVLAASSAVLVSGSVTRGISTDVNATFCQSGESGSMSVVSPVSTAVVSNNTITISGTVSLVSQVRVDVDGVYAQTIPIDRGASVFQAEVTLAPGVHAVHLEAIDICGQTTPTADLTITYNPDATHVGTSTSTGGVASSNQSPTHVDTSYGVDGTEENSSHPFLLGVADSVQNSLYSILTQLDLARPSEYVTLPVLVQRFTIVSVGALLVITPQLLFGGYRLIWYGLLSQSAPLFPELLRSRTLSLLRIIGLVILGGFMAFVA